MQGSINFDGSLIGNITGGGGGSNVVITPVVTSGTKIADVTVNGVEKDLYCPNPPTPPEISITPVQESGTKIADISLNGVEKDLYAPNPTAVSVSQVQQSGTKIATIGVNGVNTDIYAPQGGGESVNYSTTERVVGKYKNETLYEKIIHITEPSEINSKVYTTEVQGLNAKEIFLLLGRVRLGASANNIWMTAPYYNSNQYNTAIGVTINDISVVANGWNYTEVELIVQYTKNS